MISIFIKSENSSILNSLFQLLILLFWVSCSSDNSNLQSIEIGYEGALKNIMRKGDISAKTTLQKYKDIKNLYALGALENLKGEILILDGKPFNTIVSADSIIIDSTFNKSATLFVHASVSDWIELPVPDNITSESQLIEFISETALSIKMNIKKPFPFLVEGKARLVDFHIINWKEGDLEHSHEKHINSGINKSLNDREILVLGFYSTSHHGIFTHHSSNVHMHLKTQDEQIAGHIDKLVPGKGMILKLPNLSQL